jgi:hypothetical protein
MSKSNRLLGLFLVSVLPLLHPTRADAATNLCRYAEQRVFHEVGSLTWSFWHSYWVNFC